jgi:hypothetical protein
MSPMTEYAWGVMSFGAAGLALGVIGLVLVWRHLPRNR